MQQLKDYPILDLSRGLQQDKSPYLLKDNELYVANNIELEPGRVKKRRGSRQYGGFSIAPDTDIVWDNGIYVGTYNQFFITNKNTVADGGAVYYLYGVGSVTSAITAGDTTINVSNVGLFGGNITATIEIEGDLISYTGSGAGILTGCTGVTSNHPVGAAVRQWTIGYNSVATDQGTWFAYLNGIIVLSRGSRGWDTFNGSWTNRNGNSAPKYITTYKQRVYGVSISTSGNQRVVYTPLTDPTTFSESTNYFDVEDDRGEAIVNLKSYNGRLAMFKTNSTFHYDLSTLSLANDQVGTFNDRTVQEINGLLYTLSPNGAFATNLADFKDIGKPVKDFLENADYAKYPPRTGRVEDLWVIYIGTVTVDQKIYTDTVLAYDTSSKSWAVWTGFTNFQNFICVDSFKDNYDSYDVTAYITRNVPTLFWGTTTQKLFRMFNDKTSTGGGTTYLNRSAGTVTTGGDILEDKFFNTGDTVPSEVMTKFFHQNAPGWWKQFRYVRALSELWPFSIDCRTMIQNGYSPWKSLGQVSGPNVALPINLEGYAIQFRINESSKNKPWVLNGLILEKTMAMTQNHN